MKTRRVNIYIYIHNNENYKYKSIDINQQVLTQTYKSDQTQI